MEWKRETFDPEDIIGLNTEWEEWIYGEGYAARDYDCGCRSKIHILTLEEAIMVCESKIKEWQKKLDILKNKE